MGGAMDLVHGAKRVHRHDGAHRQGRRTKIVEECTLPLTGRGVRPPDHHRPGGPRRRAGRPVLRELAPGVTAEEVRERTELAAAAGFVTGATRRPPCASTRAAEAAPPGAARHRGARGVVPPGHRTRRPPCASTRAAEVAPPGAARHRGGPGGSSPRDIGRDDPRAQAQGPLRWPRRARPGTGGPGRLSPPGHRTRRPPCASRGPLRWPGRGAARHRGARGVVPPGT